MKVVCIDDYDLSGNKYPLTPDKIYDTIETFTPDYSKNGVLSIINDEGCKFWFPDYLFMPIDKWRELKLNEIGI